MSSQASLKLTSTQRLADWFNHPWLLRSIMMITFLGVVGVFIQQIKFSEILPIKKVRVTGSLVHVNEAMLRNAIAGKIHGGYFNLNISHIKDVVEKMPWIKGVNVRRVWPDTVSISVIEETPVAIWNNKALLNNEGIVFIPDDFKVTGLPEFITPDGTGKLAIKWFNMFQAKLIPQQLKISRLIIDTRRAITLELENGVTVVLGREIQLKRLSRFIDIYNHQLNQNIAMIKKIDLRYSNGLAVQWNQRFIEKQIEMKLNGLSAPRVKEHLNHV
jgi:cell division protein FtsQ